MPTLYRGNGWRITMYFRDHDPPHFHIITRDHKETQVKMEDLTVIVGDVPPAIVRAASSWASANMATLRGVWEDFHPTRK